MALGLNKFDSTLIQEFTNDFDESSVNSESRIGHMTNSLDSKASPDKLSSGDCNSSDKPVCPEKSPSDFYSRVSAYILQKS